MNDTYEYLEESDFDTILDQDVEFSGTIEAEETTIVKGVVTKCTIDATLLLVVQSGMIEGNITVDKLSVLGTCKGELTVHDTLHLLQGGRVEGKLSTHSLIVGTGGILNAECRVLENKDSTKG